MGDALRMAGFYMGRLYCGFMKADPGILVKDLRQQQRSEAPPLRSLFIHSRPCLKDS